MRGSGGGMKISTARIEGHDRRSQQHGCSTGSMDQWSDSSDESSVASKISSGFSQQQGEQQHDSQQYGESASEVRLEVTLRAETATIPMEVVRTRALDWRLVWQWRVATAQAATQLPRLLQRSPKRQQRLHPSRLLRACKWALAEASR